jgi:hypothetical protein
MKWGVTLVSKVTEHSFAAWSSGREEDLGTSLCYHFHIGLLEGMYHMEREADPRSARSFTFVPSAPTWRVANA